MVNRNHKDLIVTESADVREVLQDADYVVTTLRVGGDHSRVIDETIALNAGVIGQETTGVGGFSMAVRTIPILLEYCRLINEIAPNAWIFNFTNPSGNPVLPPYAVTFNAPQALPQARHSSRPFPVRNPYTKPALNESPAPVVSTAFTRYAGRKT